MASYHLSVKTVSRSQGRSATAAAAYRAGEVIPCERYGVEHDYTRKVGIEHTEIFAPEDAPDWAEDRAALWNAVEASENRKNSMVAREWEVALPHELDADQRRELVASFSRDLVDRYGVVADVAIHEPHRDGDQRNHHAHILTTTRTVTPEGLDAKTRELHGKSGSEEIKSMREHWAELSNAALERAGQSERVDHRSLSAQREEAELGVEDASERGDEEEAERQRQRVEHLDRFPEPKLGVAATGQERRAQRRAEREGREYVPVTERGAAVARSRAERSMVAEARERFDAARGAYAEAREDGQGRASATSEALKALLARTRQTPEERATSERLAALVERSAAKPEQDERREAYPEPSSATSEKLREMLERQERQKAERDARGEARPALPLPGADRQEEDERRDKAEKQREKPLSAAQQRRQNRERGIDRDDGLDR